MLIKKTILSLFLLLVCITSFGQSSEISEEEKPTMIVLSANYGLLLGYAFYIEHRGSNKNANRKEIYKRIEDETSKMNNPSDAMNFMNDFGYDLLQVYSFPKGTDAVTINYVFKKKGSN